MTEPVAPLTSTSPPDPVGNEVEFETRVVRPVAPSRYVRAGVVLGSALLFVVGAMAAMGASPSPSTDAAGASPAPGTSAAPSTDPGTTKDERGAGRFGFGGFGGHGGPGFGGVTITAINGSSISLKTDDGWTRTITVTADTTVTRAGEAITLADLAVGDQIGFRQDRATDGTYSITAIHVVLPRIAGQVTAVDGATITVKQFDGTTAKIHVSGATTYVIGDKTDAALSDVTVDTFIVAAGSLRDDGSLDAEAIRAGAFSHGDGDHRGRGWPGVTGTPNADPNASPSPSTTLG